MSDRPAPTVSNLFDDAEATVRRLSRACCDPDRNPHMQRLAGTLAAGRAAAAPDGAPFAEEQCRVLVNELADAGGQVGTLQVTCCTSGRAPLYHRLLEDLAAIQLEVTRRAGIGH